jgi:hypothetical protein
VSRIAGLHSTNQTRNVTVLVENAVKTTLSNSLSRLIFGGFLLAAAGCAVQPGNDPALAAKEQELVTTRETVTQLKKELEAFKIDRDAIEAAVKHGAEVGTKKDLEALRAAIAEKDGKIAELEKATASPASAKPEMAVVTFTSGRKTTCQVISYTDNKLTVRLPSGQITQAGLSGIQSIEWQSTGDAGGNGAGGSTTPTPPSSSSNEFPPPSPPPGTTTLPEAPPKEVATITTPVPPPTTPSPPPSPPPTGVPQGKAIALSGFWKTPVPGMSQMAKELGSLLKEKVHGGFDPAAPAENTQIYPGITYLMPVEQAFKTLNQRRTTKKPVNVSGFPKASFFTYEFSGTFEAGFSDFVLIADNADQVVAVQLSDSKGGSRLGWSESGSSSFNSYNFVLGRKKANTEWYVNNRVYEDDDTIIIESELKEAYYRVKERNRLILPKPVAKLLLTVCELY